VSNHGRMRAIRTKATSCREIRARTTRRAVFVIRAFAGFFGIVGLAAIVVGVHDVSLNQVGFGVTAGSVLLIGIGVTLEIGAYQLVLLGRPSTWPHGVRPPCKLVVLAACFLTLLLGTYVLIVGLSAAGSQWPFVVVVATLLVAVSLLGLRFFGGREHAGLPKLGAAVVLGIVGTVIGAWEFWYQHQYIPSQGGHTVVLTAKLEDEAQQGAFDAIRATVGYENVGDKSVWVLGSVYTLTGSRVVGCSQPATPKLVKNDFDFLTADPQRLRYMADAREERTTVLAAGKFVGDGRRLDPNLLSSRDLVFYVPRHGYQLLRFRAQLFAIPGSVRLSQRTKPRYLPVMGDKPLKNDNELYGLWHIDDDSWFHDLVYGRERWVVLRYELVDPDQPGGSRVTPAMRITARFPDPTWSRGYPSFATLGRLFGKALPSDASEPFADTEMALQPTVATGNPCS
jgi:hypothetical protein